MKLYELILSDEEVQGIDAISVVGSPAMESQFIMLSEEKKVEFAKVDEEKQILLGVAMIPEKKIYRVDPDTNEEFNVFFSKETIKRASELYLKKGNQSNANLEHSKVALSGTIVESWIVEDLKKDIGHYGDEKEKCVVWVHEFKRNPEKEFVLALGDVSYFELMNE